MAMIIVEWNLELFDHHRIVLTLITFSCITYIKTNIMNFSKLESLNGLVESKLHLGITKAVFHNCIIKVRGVIIS